jgi:hypothetical protein
MMAGADHSAMVEAKKEMNLDLRGASGLIRTMNRQRPCHESGPSFQLCKYCRSDFISIPRANDLQIKPDQAIREKWDWALPPELRLRSYVSARLDLQGAQHLAQAMYQASDVTAR